MRVMRECAGYLNEDSPGFVVEYRGNFKEQVDKLDYACGDIITDTLAVVSVPYKYLDRLRKDVPAIAFIEFRNIYVLQDISPIDNGTIANIKANPYLNLTGRGVLVGIVDTGIDYLNKEFMREDGLTRIAALWDQSVSKSESSKMYIGNEYTRDDINEAIRRKNENLDPYEVVPSKDENGHGTKMASIIGARGFNKDIEGVANDCEYVVVKLFPSPNFARRLANNGIKPVPAYNNSEVISAIAYLRDYTLKVRKPMVIFIGVGSTEGSHDGRNITSKFLTNIASNRGIALVAGSGNEGSSEGHVTEFVEGVGNIKSSELIISREIKYFSFQIWAQRPNKISLNIITPAGEESGFILVKINREDTINFVLTKTTVTVKYYEPEEYTGNEAIFVSFTDIKPGIWKFQLRGEFVTDGRYDIWLEPKVALPEGVRFLNPNPYSTLTVPSTAVGVITVAFYNSIKNTLVPESGKGFNVNGYINPDITTGGVDIKAMGPNGIAGSISGSSAAGSIVAGASALLLQWGIIDRNDITMYSLKVKSYLIYGARRELIGTYPNETTGYGFLDLDNTFKVIGGVYRRNRIINPYEEFYKGNIFIRIDKSVYKFVEERRDII